MGRGRCNIGTVALSPLPLAGEGARANARAGEGVCETQTKKHPLPAASRRPSPASGRGESKEAMPDLLPPDLSTGALAFLLATAFIAALARGFSGFGAALIFLPLAAT